MKWTELIYKLQKEHPWPMFYITLVIILSIVQILSKCIEVLGNR